MFGRSGCKASCFSGGFGHAHLSQWNEVVENSSRAVKGVRVVRNRVPAKCERVEDQADWNSHSLQSLIRDCNTISYSAYDFAIEQQHSVTHAVMTSCPIVLLEKSGDATACHLSTSHLKGCNTPMLRIESESAHQGVGAANGAFTQSTSLSAVPGWCSKLLRNKMSDDHCNSSARAQSQVLAWHAHEVRK
eukprot:2988156-Amphidinium_carterae.1